MAVRIFLDITQNSQSTSGNTSNVTAKVTASWTYGSHNNTGECSGTIKIDGVEYSFDGITFNANKTTSGSQVIMTKTVNVSHNSDGTKTLACSASFWTGLGSGTVTASATKTLTTIPRTSKPTVSSSSVDMGAAVTINTNRKSTSFTHDLAYSFAGGSYVSIATGVGASYSWTTPDLADKIPNATSGTVTIRCITKKSGSTVGTQTVTMTLKVPASVVPTISAVTATEATSGLAAQFGFYVKSKSTVKVAITAAGAKGSTIKSYSTTFNGKTYTGSSWTSDVITTSGAATMVVTVTDSRGRTARKTTSIPVWDYSTPDVYALQVYRVNEQGEADQDGAYIAVRYKYAVTSLNGKNRASMVVEYKQSTATEWTSLLTGTALSADTTALPTSPTFSTDYQYDVRLTVTDWFGAVGTYTAQLQSGAVILDIRSDGLGLGLFKTAEREGVDFGASPKGAVLGLWEATAEIPENGKFSDYLLPGVYNVPRNDTMLTIADRPCDRAGTLRVSSGIGTKKVAGAYAYIVQEFHPYHNTEPIYRRHLISDASGAFEPGPWRAITFRGQKVLWEGGKYMTADHQADLSEPVSQQDNGIVLVFSTYQNGAPIDANFNMFFVPKQFISLWGGYGSAYQMNTVNFNTVGAKYLYIHDTYIKGNENNNLSGTATSGITFNNAMYVLRYVLGV
jgi:hypothetical protein